MKLIYLTTGILCFIGILHLPIGYYTFLRMIVFIASFLFAYQEFQKTGITFWIIVFGIIGILFNPVFPIYLYDKGIWVVIDIIVGIIFTGLFLKQKTNK